MKKPKVRKFGRVFIKYALDLNGHWITSEYNHKHMLWFWFGPSYEDDLRIWNFVIGPIGLAFAIEPV